VICSLFSPPNWEGDPTHRPIIPVAVLMLLFTLYFLSGPYRVLQQWHSKLAEEITFTDPTLFA